MVSSLIRGKFVLAKANNDASSEIVEDGAVYQRERHEILQQTPHAP